MTTTCTMILGDCLDVMPTLPAIADFVFADIPYGVLSATWDCRLPLDTFWSGVKATRRKASPVCLMATNPYASEVIESNKSNFSYDLIWTKGRGTGAFQAKRRPMRAHETMLLFYGAEGHYFPQMRKASRTRRGMIQKPAYDSSVFGPIKASSYTYADEVFPLSWVRYEPDHARNKIHSSQKPHSMMEWLVRSYCPVGGCVFDPVAGAGSSALAAASCGCSVVCCEIVSDFHEDSVERVRKHIRDNLLDVKIEVRK